MPISVKCQYCGTPRIIYDKRVIKKISANHGVYACPNCVRRTKFRSQLSGLLIDWDRTEQSYGYRLEAMPYRGSVVVACAECGQPLHLKFRGPKALAKQIGRVTHRSCFHPTTEQKEEARRNSAAYWSDPKSHQLASEIIMGLWRDEDYRSAVVDSLAKCEDSFTNWDQVKRSKHSKALWQRDSFRRKLLKFLQSDEQRQLMIELWADDNYRARMAQTAFFKPQPSKLQRRLIPIFDRHNISWVEEHLIRFYHFDYFLPNLSVLIEVQGNYWHSKPEAIARDKRKRTFVANNTSLRLVEVWEDEFSDLEKLDAKIAGLAAK